MTLKVWGRLILRAEVNSAELWLLSTLQYEQNKKSQARIDTRLRYDKETGITLWHEKLQLDLKFIPLNKMWLKHRKKIV